LLLLVLELAKVLDGSQEDLLLVTKSKLLSVDLPEVVLQVQDKCLYSKWTDFNEQVVDILEDDDA
jgi:hypothetical protein